MKSPIVIRRCNRSRIGQGRIVSFNGKAPQEVITALVDKNGRQLLPSTYDESKWAKAAAAAYFYVLTTLVLSTRKY